MRNPFFFRSLGQKGREHTVHYSEGRDKTKMGVSVVNLSFGIKIVDYCERNIKQDLWTPQE